jgi:hypothetical protein
MPLATLDLTAMNIDEADRSFSVLEAQYGEGYSDGVLVGSAAGLHNWVLTSGGVLTDHTDYVDLISSDPTFKYYWDFFAARMAEGNGPFILAWRAKNYHAKFVDKNISAEVFAKYFLSTGFNIRQHRIVGQAYEADGSITPTPEP